MENMSYEKTFELMKAYAKLGIKEQTIMENLFETDVFEGGYSKLAKQINMEVSNVRNTLKYLDALGVVNICYDKPINEIEVYQNKNGKIINKHNHMKACFIVDGWMEILIKHYQNGNIYRDEVKKKAYTEKMTELLLKEMEIED